MIPLYGFVSGDSLGVVVLVQEHDTIGDVALQLQRAAAVRVAPRPRVQLFAHGRPLDRFTTVKLAGLVALDRVDVVPEDA